MNSTPRIIDQQLIVHLFAPVTGPYAETAYHRIQEIWVACRGVLEMVDPIAGLGLPHQLPACLAELPEFPSPAQHELAIAAQEQSGSDSQAIVRRHHDLLNLSVAIAPRRAGSAGSWWHELERRWYAVTGGLEEGLIGQARIYAATVAAPAPEAEVLGRQLGSLLPPMPQRQRWWQRPTRFDDHVVAWDAGPDVDTRAERRLIVVAPAANDPHLSATIWSDGRVTIPPLARYLMHVAKVRYMMRVWANDPVRGPAVEAIAAHADKLRRLIDGDPMRAAPELRGWEDEQSRLEMLRSELAHMRDSVEIAASNVGTALALAPLNPHADGLVAEDKELITWFATQLTDDEAYLAAAAQRAERVMARLRKSPPAAQETAVDAVDIKRSVFVVYGRDLPLRDEMFDFLRALGLRPLEWEQLIDKLGKPSPYLGDVVREAVRFAQATLVILSPDDIVDLHSDLYESGEVSQPAMQARPNVLIELGMALGLYPDRTVIVHVGDMRPIADLGGLNYVRLDDSADCRRKIANRLSVAGCAVDLTGTDWLSRNRFTSLAAFRRVPGK